MRGRGETPNDGPVNREPSTNEDETQSRILIVDDNPDIVRVVQRILKSRGYESLVARDGNEALEAARRERPDLILLDWMLPGIDGLEVCRQLKSDPETRGMMIILVTGRGSIDNRVEGFDAGADDYIPKPFNHPELLARIRSALRLKKLADDLEERNRQLVESQNERVRSEKMATIGLLASGIAHEFNNIMAGISGYAQLAKKDPKHAPQLVEVALTQSERAVELTRSLSTYNRQDSEQVDCSVQTVVENALCLVRKEIEAHSIDVKKKVTGAPRAAISPGRLQEVVLNLVINAIHAVGDKGTVTIEVAPRPENEVEIRVSDNGSGIPAANLGRIFDPFFTTKGALGGGKQEGSGLGLSVCYNLIQCHGGHIEVDSTEGEGTTFTVTLPSPVDAPLDDDAGDEIGGTPPPPPAHDEPLRILVTDDESPIREMLKEFLSDHEVICCNSGDEALRRYVEKKFDYVILDICMQDSVNGLETLRLLKKMDPDVKVILATGRFPDEMKLSDLEMCYAHLLKPFKFEALAALLGLDVAVPA